MRFLYTVAVLLLVLSALFLYPFNIGGDVGVRFSAEIMGTFSFAAFITALISYIQFIFPKRFTDREGEYNRIPFQSFNMIFVLPYFLISTSFLVANKQFFPGYEMLPDNACIKKYYLSNGLNSISQIFIASSVIINLIYIITHGIDYIGQNRKDRKEAATFTRPD